MGARFRRLALCATLILAACVGWASSASAATPIATLTAESPISAGGGWLLWSTRTPGGWQLEAFHDGKVSTLAVPLRPRPFDVKVGTSSSDAAVATFSRCMKTPAAQTVGYQGSDAGGMLVEPNSGAGCRIRVLELQSGREALVPIPTVNGVSDTTPSMWDGRVVFARKTPSHRRVSQLMLWSPAHPRQLRTLRHGALPDGCPHIEGCTEKPAGGEVQATSYDGKLAAFVWKPEGPTVAIEGAWEDRIDVLRDGAHALVRSPIGTESCTSPESNPDLIEEEWPEPPLLDGASALFPTLTRGDCYKADGALLLGYDSDRLTKAQTSKIVLALASDGSTTYALVAQKPADEQDPGCSVLLPCTLQTFSAPQSKPIPGGAHHPFGF